MPRVTSVIISSAFCFLAIAAREATMSIGAVKPSPNASKANSPISAFSPTDSAAALAPRAPPVP